MDMKNLPSFSKDKWNAIGKHKRAGVVAPLFSVYSGESVGIGEFEDIKILVDWCVKTGNSIIQFLPLNETGGLFCPYDSISSFALEPAYVSLRLIDGAGKKEFKSRITKIKKNFPCGKAYVNYNVKFEKYGLLWDMFLQAKDTDCPDFKKFMKSNSGWLDDFAVFKVAKFVFGEKPWYDWPREFKDRDQEALKRFRQDNAQGILFHKWVQWNLFKQFKDARDYAGRKKVLLKGDLPVLVSRDSADVWARRDFFKMEYAAGAPVDMYCARGQRWGMPTYNWDAIARDNYDYIKEKLSYAQNFYDILRVDHVVGLFRIWSIPVFDSLENQGLNGKFDPADEKIWGKQGKEILTVMLKNTNMLLCAEDLGMIPQVCTDTLKNLGIPGNDVQRWVKDWKVRHDFLPFDEYRSLSVTMLSTHDTTNWPAWWENEAGTVDEDLFARKCGNRGIDFGRIKELLFDLSRSKYGRLRWQESVECVDTLCAILSRPREQIGDFIEMYQNTYKEKDKLWELLGLTGDVREEADAEVIAAAMNFSFNSSAVFAIQLLADWLIYAGVFKPDYYQHRINRPGTISNKNWSLTCPVSLEGLLKLKVNEKIKKIIDKSGRA